MKRAAHPFWRFSLRSYRRSGVEQACLGLQNTLGADVNLLLFCCWMGTQGRPLTKRSLRRAVAAVQRWQREVVQPLRRARRALRKSSAAVAEARRAHLRRNVLSLELDAEYVEQLVLACLAAKLPRPARKQDPQTASAANLERYLELLGAPLGRTTKRRMMTLCRT